MNQSLESGVWFRDWSLIQSLESGSESGVWSLIQSLDSDSKSGVWSLAQSLESDSESSNADSGQKPKYAELTSFYCTFGRIFCHFTLA